MDLRFWFCASCLACTFALPARAEMVVPSTMGDSPWLTAGPSDASSGQLLADTFTIESPAIIRRVEWSGAYRYSVASAEHERFSISVFRPIDEANGWAPAYSHMVASTLNRSPAIADGIPLEMYTYSATIPETHLNPGQYLLSIVSHSSAEEDEDWLWTLGYPSGDGIFTNVFEPGSEIEPAAWTASQTQGDFRPAADFSLHGTTAVPEPASLASLAFCATLGCAGARRAWRRRVAGAQSDEAS